MTLGANNKANSSSPSVTVPAGCSVGDVFLVQMTQNNTNVITTAPAGLTLVDTNTTVATYPNHLYVGVVDGITISPGSVLAWGLSATRQWSLDLVAWPGVDTANPIHAYSAIGSATTSGVTPSLATTITAKLVEIVSAKGNGTTITAWTPPTGWTSEQAVAAAGTFAGSAVIADRDANPSAAGTYGGDTYTPNQTPGATMRYTVALKPLAAAQSGTADGSGSATGSVLVGVLAAGAALAIGTASIGLATGDGGLAGGAATTSSAASGAAVAIGTAGSSSTASGAAIAAGATSVTITATGPALATGSTASSVTAGGSALAAGRSLTGATSAGSGTATGVATPGATSAGSAAATGSATSAGTAATVTGTSIATGSAWVKVSASGASASAGNAVPTIGAAGHSGANGSAAQAGIVAPFVVTVRAAPQTSVPMRTLAAVVRIEAAPRASVPVAATGAASIHLAAPLATIPIRSAN